MKKLLIILSTTALLSMSAVGMAGSLTLVNKYHLPVVFAVSDSPVYNPVFIGSVDSGEKAMLKTDGFFNSEYYFTAYSPMGSNVVSYCGHPTDTVFVNPVVVAGISPHTGDFGCFVYEGNTTPVKHVTHVKHMMKK